ncbi:hypothetical protein OCU04_003350 [Sclerotinia nivalis]|uniref:37S ribosomal protein mrp51, mitochondrial n=1 Tax=Sclerotinia nivalis TaxID=352851 RepID=A0A9X0ARQ6_9HELO|nr:hypothetical protein OCU04_003350 [Sclerotinia nivalis]
MASTRMSPGGALLRASRVFAIPNPLPRPTGNLSSQATFDSDTATLPHPIHQSITTPQSSLAKGDWGFKRPLPLRATTRTSTPIIRVESIDTFEHVTEFGSAADHSLTLRKWQEMNIPISTPRPSKSVAVTTRDQNIPKHRSVFEDNIDTTVRNDSLNPALIAHGKDDTRWKFSGPWLAGLTEGEFQAYVAKEVGRKKSEFRQFLKESCVLSLTSDARAKAYKNDEDLANIPMITADQITEEQLSTYIRHLRYDISTLYQQIRVFLDLAPSPAPRPEEDSPDYYDLGSIRRPKAVDIPTSPSPYAESGPPKTHPSAGLSYSRSSSWTYNHALYGPQAHHPPIEARIVMPKNASGAVPVLGVGGVVVDIPAGFTQFDVRPSQGINGPRAQEQVAGLLYVEPEKYGGSKTWVEPKHAYIDAKGKIVLSVLPADRDAVAVKEDKVDEIPEPLQWNYTPPVKKTSHLKQNGSGEGYGLSGF